MERASLGINDLLMEGNLVIVVFWVSQGKSLGNWVDGLTKLLIFFVVCVAFSLGFLEKPTKFQMIWLTMVL